jgi:2-C-methyl-D-erythritol 2,4-cyclodiphosphate synthase
MSLRIGFGFDVHQLKEKRAFWLGGIRLKHTKGASGHSDADVLIHALCDALLGAANLGDIGSHFPDTSPEFKNIDSKKLLKRVLDLIADEGYSIVNIDSTVSLEKPKIKAAVPAMKKVLSAVMSISENQLSIKAGTNEKMGYVGREEGVCAYAVVLIEKK